MSHFYILEAHSSITEKQKFIRKSIDQFIIDVIQTEKNISRESAKSQLQLGHGDVLYITKSDKGQEYTLKSGDFDPFFNFLSYKNLELKQRFIIVENAHLIGKTLANKLLKSLEEPTPDTTIFFLTDSTSHMLDTILSRAIKWTLRDENMMHQEFIGLKSKVQLIQYLCKGSKRSEIIGKYLNGDIPLHELLDKASKKSDYEELFKILINALTETQYFDKSKESLLNQMKWWSKARKYHNSPQETLINLLSSL